MAQIDSWYSIPGDPGQAGVPGDTNFPVGDPAQLGNIPSAPAFGQPVVSSSWSTNAGGMDVPELKVKVESIRKLVGKLENNISDLTSIIETLSVTIRGLVLNIPEMIEESVEKQMVPMKEMVEIVKKGIENKDLVAASGIAMKESAEKLASIKIKEAALEEECSITKGRMGYEFLGEK